MSDLECADGPPILLEQLRSGAIDWTDARVPALLAWIRAGQRRSELQMLTAASLTSLDAARACELVDVLIELEHVELAYKVSALPRLAADPALAARRARLAMQRRDYAAAVDASDASIAALLQPGLSIAEFLQRCSTGAPAEGMLRFERQVLAERTHLSERLALRWEALHRAERTREASLMQWMCQRYFPERASVWATAGNHALDADDVAAAERYFQRCLELNADWTSALAGMAIVWERRKEWAAALPYRRRVVEVEQALERTDAASLQRRVRYAAALARVGDWTAAEPLFRAAVSCGAYLQLPAERPVLLRVFSQELYAPMLVADMLRSASPDAADPAVTLAAHEAWLIARVRAAVSGDRWGLALCAYLSGAHEQAYELLDQLECERPNDLAVHYLLWRCARAIGHPQTGSIRAFAEEAAHATWSQLQAAAPEPLEASARARSQAHQYVRALLPELPVLAHQLPNGAGELAPIDAPIVDQLERIAAYRATREASGCSPLAAAASSTHALAAAASRQ